jgi:hypothetical protein
MRSVRPGRSTNHESSGSGIRSGCQGPLFDGGNAYLAREFPRLDYIVRAVVSLPAGPE